MTCTSTRSRRAVNAFPFLGITKRSRKNKSLQNLHPREHAYTEIAQTNIICLAARSKTFFQKQSDPAYMDFRLYVQKILSFLSPIQLPPPLLFSQTCLAPITIFFKKRERDRRCSVKQTWDVGHEVYLASRFLPPK